MANPCLTVNQSDFRGYPFVEYTYVKTASFIRNNCPSGQNGSAVSYSKTYTSYISERHLQELIDDDASNFNAQGQANANANGTCSVSCVAKTTTSMQGEIVAASSTDLYLTGSYSTGNSFLDEPVGCFSVPLSTATSGSGAIPTTAFIHNYSTRPTYVQGSNNGWRLVQNGNNLDLMYGSGSTKCLETVFSANLPAGNQGHKYVYDYKYVYGGLGNPINGLYYLVLTGNSRLSFYYLSQYESTARLIGDCVAPSDPSDPSARYGFYSPFGGNTKAFIVPLMNNTMIIVAYTRRYHSGLTTFDNNRTRTLIWQVNTDPITGEPTSINRVYNEYNNDRLVIHSAIAYGSNYYAIFYRLNRSGTSHGLLTNGPMGSVGLASGHTILSAVGNSNYAYLYVYHDSGTHFIRYYNVSTNSWTNGRMNL